MNQQGDIQAIGGVNEKIEGFFDVCRIAGLSGTQGVMIPASNVEDLMLRDDVLEAVAAGQVHVWPAAEGGKGGSGLMRIGAVSCNRVASFHGGAVFAEV